MAEEAVVSTESADTGEDQSAARLTEDDFASGSEPQTEVQEGEAEAGEEEGQEKAPAKKESRSKVEKVPKGKEEDEEEEEAETEKEGEKEVPEEEEAEGTKKPEKAKKGEIPDDTLVPYKVDGKEIVRPFGEVKRLASMAEAAHRRFEEAAQMRKRYEAGVQAIIRDPKKSLMALFTHQFQGDKRKAEEYLVAVADSIVADKFEEEKLPPHERAIREKQREIEDLRAQLEARQRQEYEEELSAKTEAFRQRRTKQIREALKAGGLPTDDKRLGLMVDQMMWDAQDNGFELSAADAVAELVSQRKKAVLELAKTASLKELMEYYPDLESKVSKETLRKVKQQIGSEQSGDDEATEKARAQPPRKQRYYNDMEELLADQRR